MTHEERENSWNLLALFDWVDMLSCLDRRDAALKVFSKYVPVTVMHRATDLVGAPRSYFTNTLIM